MEVYKSEAREVLRRYSAGLITHNACITALNAAVVGLVPFLPPDELKILQDSMKSTHEALGLIPL